MVCCFLSFLGAVHSSSRSKIGHRSSSVVAWLIRQAESTRSGGNRLLVTVDEGIAPLASASKPDLHLSAHPAPQSPDPLARIALLTKSLERSPFTAPTHVSSLPLGSLRRLWAYPL